MKYPQRRAAGDVDFYRDWTAYRDGFGFLTGDFWLGNEAIHTLTDAVSKYFLSSILI